MGEAVDRLRELMGVQVVGLAARDGDGDGLVNDGTPQERPYVKQVVSGKDVQVGDRLDSAKKTRVAKVSDRNGHRLAQTRTTGTRSPSIEKWPHSAKVTVWRKSAAKPAAPTHPQITRDMLSNPDTPRTRAVSAEEFQRLAEQGRARLEKFRQNASDPTGLTKNWDRVRSDAYQATRSEWGGTTIDAHTGEALPDGAKKWALTVKAQGMESESVPMDASEDEFNAAMDRAKARFAAELRNQQHYLGVFRDEDSNRIDIDPVLVVDNHDDVETVGAYTGAVGGAYAFFDGNGYWPPYVGQ